MKTKIQSKTILSNTVRRLTNDESGESAVKYLRQLGLSVEEENYFFRKAEDIAYPPLNHCNPMSRAHVSLKDF